MNETHWCPECAEVTAHDRFACGDHDHDCVELVCRGCGLGIELSGLLVTTGG
jgi:hypothetical protein